MTFNLVSAPPKNSYLFGEVKVGEGFLSSIGEYYIKIAYDRAIRVGFVKNQPPADEEGVLYENSFSPDDPVAEIYYYVSVIME